MSEGRPAFIISFDCEGHWGMMDHLEEHGRLGTAALEAAYGHLLSLLERHGLAATFAFVGAFTLSEEEFRGQPALLEGAGPASRRWLAPFLRDLEARRTEGWFAPGAAAAVRRAGRHELAAHGFTHLPLLEGELDGAELDRELSGVRRLPAFSGAGELTLVFPRNQVGFTGELASRGYAGYRDTLARPRHARSSRWRHLFDEANPFPSAQPHLPPAGGVAVVPAGRMLNWRSGPRGAIPVSWTAGLWRRTLEDALRRGGVAHLWSHPHNFVTGRDMFELLESVLAHAAPLVRSGRLWNPTMLEYARARRGTP